MNKYLSVSVVTATFNSERTLGRCLDSVRKQVYPQDRIELIIADGGSKDKTLKIAESYGAKVYHVNPSLQSAEYNKSIGIKYAKNELILMLDHDNVMTHNKWLQNMVKPFLDHPEIVGSETLRYHYDKNTSLIDRYFALYGAGDPIVWYLGRADRLSYMFDRYNLAGHTVDKGNYYDVTFQNNNIPTIGANGFFVRRATLIHYAQTQPGKYFDMDVNVDLIKHGFTHYAFVKEGILHLTGYGSIWYFLKRRLLYMNQYHLGNSNRRYAILEKKDLPRLIFVIIICITVIIPLYDSLRGFKKIHDWAWFLHPILCMSFVVLYSWVIMKHQIETYGKKILAT